MLGEEGAKTTGRINFIFAAINILIFIINHFTMLSVTVMIISDSKETISTITIEVPEEATIKDLSDFLK